MCGKRLGLTGVCKSKTSRYLIKFFFLQTCFVSNSLVCINTYDVVISWIGELFAVETPRHICVWFGRIMTGQINRVQLKNVEVHGIAFHVTQKHRFICVSYKIVTIIERECAFFLHTSYALENTTTSWHKTRKVRNF